MKKHLSRVPGVEYQEPLHVLCLRKCKFLPRDGSCLYSLSMIIGDPSRFNKAYSESYSGLRIEDFWAEVGKGTSIIYHGPGDGKTVRDFAEVTD